MPDRPRTRRPSPFFSLWTGLLFLLILACAPLACRNDEQIVSDDVALAENALNRRDLDDATMYFERYLRKNSDGPRRWLVWQRLLDISLNLRQDRTTARSYLEIMLQEFEEDHEKRRSLQLLLARVCRDTNDYERATVLWEALIRDPRTPDSVKAGVCIDLSKAYLRRLEFIPATDTLSMCAQLDAGIALKADCLYALGETQVLTENLEAAEATLNDAVSLPSIPEDRRVLAVFTLADVLEQQGRRAKAIELFESIRSSYPNERVVELRISRLKKKKN